MEWTENTGVNSVNLNTNTGAALRCVMMVPYQVMVKEQQDWTQSFSVISNVTGCGPTISLLLRLYVHKTQAEQTWNLASCFGVFMRWICSMLLSGTKWGRGQADKDQTEELVKQERSQNCTDSWWEEWHDVSSNTFSEKSSQKSSV